MSRLIYQGNLNKNFGEFFPTPYIDKVILTDKLVDGYEEGLEMEIQYSLLLPFQNMIQRCLIMIKIL